MAELDNLNKSEIELALINNYKLVTGYEQKIKELDEQADPILRQIEYWKKAMYQSRSIINQLLGRYAAMYEAPLTIMYTNGLLYIDSEATITREGKEDGYSTTES